MQCLPLPFSHFFPCHDAAASDVAARVAAMVKRRSSKCRTAAPVVPMPPAVAERPRTGVARFSSSRWQTAIVSEIRQTSDEEAPGEAPACAPAMVSAGAAACSMPSATEAFALQKTAARTVPACVAFADASFTLTEPHARPAQAEGDSAEKCSKTGSRHPHTQLAENSRFVTPAESSPAMAQRKNVASTMSRMFAVRPPTAHRPSHRPPSRHASHAAICLRRDMITCARRSRREARRCAQTSATPAAPSPSRGQRALTMSLMRRCKKKT